MNFFNSNSASFCIVEIKNSNDYIMNNFKNCKFVIYLFTQFAILCLKVEMYWFQFSISCTTFLLLCIWINHIGILRILFLLNYKIGCQTTFLYVFCFLYYFLLKLAGCNCFLVFLQ